VVVAGAVDAVDLPDQLQSVLAAVDLRGTLWVGGLEKGLVGVEFLEDSEMEVAVVVVELVEGGGLGGGGVTSAVLSRAVFIIVRMPATIYLFIMSLRPIRCTFSTRAYRSFWQFLSPSSLFIMDTMRPSSGSWHFRYGIDRI
jgi:hypothetical protein